MVMVDLLVMGSSLKKEALGRERCLTSQDFQPPWKKRHPRPFAFTKPQPMSWGGEGTKPKHLASHRRYLAWRYEEIDLQVHGGWAEDEFNASFPSFSGGIQNVEFSTWVSFAPNPAAG